MAFYQKKSRARCNTQTPTCHHQKCSNYCGLFCVISTKLGAPGNDGRSVCSVLCARFCEKPRRYAQCSADALPELPKGEQFFPQGQLSPKERNLAVLLPVVVTRPRLVVLSQLGCHSHVQVSSYGHLLCLTFVTRDPMTQPRLFM